MSEGAKTITFIVVACVLGGAAYVSKPESSTVEPLEMEGKVLFQAFDDPNQAARLQIVRYDEELGQIHQFEVAKNSRTNVWNIPSHDDYPADAEEQMRDAALSLVGLKVLGVITEEPSEHELFGVVEPSRDKTKLGDQGVGILVSFQDEKGKELAELVIGKSVKDRDDMRFVRIPRQDVVYAVEIDPTQLSTKFEDWIEEDLLQLNAFDVAGLRMKDYSVLETVGGPRLELRSNVSADWNSSENGWTLGELITYRGQDEIKNELLPTEELDDEKLNDAKTALDNLKIADVRRKPAGLGGDLKADASFMDNSDNRRDLLALGFYPSRTADGGYELLSANGEIHVQMTQGHEYVLRFGGVSGTSDDSDGGLNRYLFVTARVIEGRFPMPELEPVPEGPSPAASPETEAAETDAAESDAADADAPETDAAETDAGATEADADNTAGEDVDEQQRRLAAEKERITKENARKMDEWREEKEAAEAQVRELNTRFADWYYVISEEEYRKIHLSRGDIVTESETAAEEGFNVDAFRQLEDSGLQTPAPESAP